MVEFYKNFTDLPHLCKPQRIEKQTLTLIHCCLMAIVRQRRLPTLTLDLPESSSTAAADCGPRFVLPPLHPPPATTSSSAAAASPGEPKLCDFEKLGVLGHGNGGTVYKVRHRRTAAVYALKIPNHTSDARASGYEAQILRRAAGHASIIRFHGSISAPSSGGGAALLLEHADAGSLDGLLRRRGLRPLPEPALASVARQVLLGLAHLHSLKIAHRDLKPSNLLVTSKGAVKIADFGSGKIMGRALEPCASYVGTCAYMSPERLDPGAHGGAYDACAADVWSLGLVLMELGLGRFPLLPAGQRPDWAALMCAVCFGDPPALPPESASPEFGDFVARCLQREVGQRWSVPQLLEHRFVAGRDSDDADQALRELLDSPRES